ncbi:MAG TPA: hypothetical protein VK997_13110, partial [Deferrisomatales bacterium]|nr:hypothetical protein [Deferrisomatales bacterium]
KLLAGFAHLSAADQERVRAKLGVGATANPAGACCDPTTMMAQMVGKMQAAGCDPMALCKAMMRQGQAGEGQEQSA